MGILNHLFILGFTFAVWRFADERAKTLCWIAGLVSLGWGLMGLRSGHLPMRGMADLYGKSARIMSISYVLSSFVCFYRVRYPRRKRKMQNF